jgi:hypothetical protein
VKDTGLFGLYLVGEQENMDSALECVAAGIKRLAVRGTVEEAELRRAKTQLKVWAPNQRCNILCSLFKLELHAYFCVCLFLEDLSCPATQRLFLCGRRHWASGVTHLLLVLVSRLRHYHCLQVLTYGRRMPMVESFARIDAVTIDDVAAMAAGFLNVRSSGTERESGRRRGAVAVAALGKIEKLPDFEWIDHLFSKWVRLPDKKESPP